MFANGSTHPTALTTQSAAPAANVSTLVGDTSTRVRAGPGPHRRVQCCGRPRPPAATSSATTDRWTAQRPRTLDGFDASHDLPAVLRRAAETERADRAGGADAGVAHDARAHRRDRARLSAHRRRQRKGCGARRGESRWFAGPLRRRSPDGRHRALGLGGRRRRPVPRGTVGGVGRRARRPGRVVAGDGAGSGLRRRSSSRPVPTSTTPPRRPSRTCRTWPPRHSPSRRARCRWHSPWPPGLSGTARGWRALRPIWCVRCARPTPRTC